MASVSRSRPTTNERSGAGGKIVRGRQIAAARARTPYDRPVAAGGAPSPNPNWLTGLIFPTSRIIATGATKLFSSVFGPETSSSSSSSGTDSSSEDGMDDGNDDYDVPYDDGGRLDETGATSELIECFGSEPQLTAGKSEIKRVIEKLVMQETFSRKECDRLIEIIKSRVIDGSTMEEEKDGTLGGIPNRTIGDVTPELCSKAVMEAKQWLEEKKVASSSKLGMDRGTCTLSSVAQSQKVYSLSSGSWNIQEEIRRVRSKATEDMLKTSARIDLPSYAWERKSLDEPLLADKKDWEGGAKLHNFDLFPATGSISASLELAAGAITSRGLPASALELTRNISWEEDFTSQPIFSSSAQIQDLEGIQLVEGEGHAGSNSRLPTIPDPAVEHDTKTYSADKEETELRGNPNTNGFCISGSSFGAGEEQTLRSSHDTSPKPVGSNLDNLVNIVPMEETCELLSEASMEVPVIYETNSGAAAGGSQGSCTMQCEELSHELSQPNPEDSLVGKTSTTVEKQQGRKLSSRYNRKSRGGRDR
ncbi:uncharacterized protein LOC131299480 isoform X2 [Rhododendron vialii]|uniref:uncharacterized protein LOC131299480 isoform X2 n=1 Tax=Rhododendron vialii TaxID=182163 RepID=UPI00265E46C0|nr:uncharacterized protein LOC131299480 isoform X2 [Rhododendron vialii]